MNRDAPVAVRLTYCLRRRPELSHDEFVSYWRTVHAPLVAAHAELLRIRRYVQLPTLDLPAIHDGFRRRNEGAPGPFDGVAELWFDDLADFVSAFVHPREHGAREAAAELLADERNFVDLGSSPMWLTAAHLVVEP